MLGSERKLEKKEVRRYGYVRVSSKSQEFNYSLDEQKRELSAHGVTLVEKEVCTGTTFDRPVLSRLVSSLEPGDELWVTRLDRLGRSLVETIVPTLFFSRG